MTPSTWAIAAILLLAYPAAAQTMAGPARVIDGDTIVIAGQHIRLFGIDAPEHAQKCDAVDASAPEGFTEYQCGRDATAALAAILGRGITACQPRNLDRYGRTVATCSTEAGDIGAQMVRQGWAVVYRQYAKGAYEAEEAEAKAEKRGIWSGRFEMPSDWRRQHKGMR